MSRRRSASSGKLPVQTFLHRLTVLALCAYSLAMLESGYDDLPVWKHLFGLFGFLNWGDD